ncbi:MAG TPA: AAA family ATPase [Thermomicrobiales bacterium]|nr:AAA family ATPase [Thermomicrobiales bacterium]
MPAFSRQAPRQSPQPDDLVGREREQVLLRDRLNAALSGRGSLVLIAGEAGIGKSTLVDWLKNEAEAHGARMLSGGCYDLTTTPPYGPWLDSFESGALPLREALSGDPDQAKAANQLALFEHVYEELARVAARQPLVLALEDLHWVDRISLDLLRYLAGRAQALPLLLVCTYRPDEITPAHPLFPLLPLLIREAQPERIDLRRLDQADIQALVSSQYRLKGNDVTRLVRYLAAHTEGNPFLLTEVLRTLQAEQLLCLLDGAWQLSPLPASVTPPLVRQVIEGRLVRLERDTRQLLEWAAIIGHRVPLDLWQSASDVESERLLDAVEQAVEARLLAPSADGASVSFVHALTREAVYEGILPPRRRARHLQIAELLLTRNPDPDDVAYHFQQAGDARAIDWLIRASERAHRVYAWVTSAELMDSAARLMETDSARAEERAWLLYKIGMTIRWTDPERGAGYVADAVRVARQAGDFDLAAVAHFFHGMLMCFTGNVRQGLAEMEAGVTELDALAPEERRHAGEGAHPTRGGLALWLGITGHFHRAADIAEGLLEQSRRRRIDAGITPEYVHWDRAKSGDNLEATTCLVLARSLAAFGHPEESRNLYQQSREMFAAMNHPAMVYASCVNELDLAIHYFGDQPSYREQGAAAAATAWSDAQGAMRSIQSLRIARLPLLAIEGDWADMRELASQHRQAHANVTVHLRAMHALGTVARAQGDIELAWEQVRDGLPGGPGHEPGDTEFLPAALLQRLAVALALDAGNLPLVRAWLDACERWLGWSEAVLGQADVALLWAMYRDASGNPGAARQRAEQALARASAPRQPLTLLAVHRFLGELATRDGRHMDADHHLAEALELSERCAAPFERAVTLRALAELRVSTGTHDDATSLLDTAREIATALNAQPVLQSIERIERIDAGTSAQVAGTHVAGLSPREIEVLRLIVEGKTDREIGAELFISHHTVARHVSSILGKLGVESRTAAATWAVRHDLS